MATKRDLVEAHQFSRRRLVTAFVSGAPDGREVEPARPGRAMVGGLALALLVVAGGAVTGLVFSRDAADWKQPGLVISKDLGQAYVISTPEDEKLVIRPVINITSARLILGPDAEPTYVSEDAISAERIGEPIGILNAPAIVPAEDDLVESGWTACTGAGSGLRLTLARRPGVAPAPGAGFLVENGGARYVIAQSAPQSHSGGGEPPGAYVYALPSDPGVQDNLLRDLGLGVGADATTVPNDWLALWPVGGALDWETFDIARVGTPAPYAGSSGIPTEARVGDIVTTPAESVVLAPAGPRPLDAFALAVLRNAIIDGQPVRELESGRIEMARLSPDRSAHWPETTLTQVRGEYCAELAAAPGQVPVVALGISPSSSASSVGIPARQRVVTVAAGGGAYVLSGSWGGTDDGSPYLVDGNGSTYPLVGPEAAENLGLGGLPAPLVPDSWVKLFDQGVSLSVADALCPPVRPSGKPCE